MRCEDARALIDAYLDGELDAAHGRELERHLETCPDCRAGFEARVALSQALRRDELRHAAPPGLRQAVLAAAGRATRAPRLDARDWWRMAASLVVAALLGAGTTFAVMTGQPDRPLVDEVVANHVRSLLVTDHAMDVASTDEHTVKPWFNGRLDYAPPVLDLAAAGFPLVGGRLDYMAGRPVAALVYRYGPHFINLFVWPAETGATAAPANLETHQGYHVVHWTGADMTWWAVSDVNAAELTAFATKVREEMPTAGAPAPK